MQWNFIITNITIIIIINYYNFNTHFKYWSIGINYFYYIHKTGTVKKENSDKIYQIFLKIRAQ